MDFEKEYELYLELDRNPQTREELKNISGNKEELKKRLSKRMEFGTAGLRARMGAGYSQMNDLTIIQTAQGLFRYLESTYPDIHSRGIVVGYDGRHNSKNWAHVTANIFLHNNVIVHLFSDVTPTPFVSFCVRLKNCVAGVMVTASHNPKYDNGYKVYGSNSAQITSPVDSHISRSILENLEPWSYSWDFYDLSCHHQKGILLDPLSDVMQKYYESQCSEICFSRVENAKCSFSVVYSPMHGVGWRYARHMTKQMGFPDTFLHVVPEQEKPDPDFPTVVFPNPEEGKASLNLSIRLADRLGINVIYANDPDADRLAIAEKSSDKWEVFTGNEIGALLSWWLFRCFITKNPNFPLKNLYMLSSTVSSKFIGTMASKKSFQHQETLTGFKWMGNLGHDLASSGNKLLFAFEEAIGFLCGDVVLDKDGIGALGVAAELTNFVYRSGKTLRGLLESIYLEYGYHISNNGYYFCYDPEKLFSMFEKLRKPYPAMCGSFEIVRVIDVTKGYDSADSEHKCRLFPITNNSQMITFFFSNGATVTIRGSGTEPKIKWYSEIIGSSSRRELESLLAELVANIVTEFYQPDKNGFVAKKD